RAPGDRIKTRRDRDPARSRARRHLAGGLGFGPPGRVRRPQPSRPAADHHRRRVRLGSDLPRRQGRSGMLRRHGRDAGHAVAAIRARRARLPASRRGQRRCEVAHRRGAGALPPAGERRRPNEPRADPMDFTLSNEQRSWQMTARKFAEEEIRPISLERDEIADPRETFDWDIIKKGSKLGFRTMAVPKEWGGQGTDFVTQALVTAELAKADSAISK